MEVDMNTKYLSLHIAKTTPYKKPNFFMRVYYKVVSCLKCF